jgi:hypothetical protein
VSTEIRVQQRHRSTHYPESHMFSLESSTVFSESPVMAASFVPKAVETRTVMISCESKLSSPMTTTSGSGFWIIVLIVSGMGGKTTRDGLSTKAFSAKDAFSNITRIMTMVGYAAYKIVSVSPRSPGRIITMSGHMQYV